jgi:methionine sulfoxide reductase heme-binding subunit
MRKSILTFLVAVAGLCGVLALTPAMAHADGGDVVVQTIPGPTLSQRVVDRAKTSWPWYLARGSGIAAAISLAILILSGIGQVTGYTFRFLEPLTAWASHRALGLAFGVSVLVHIGSLLFDRFVPFSIWQVLVPWLSHYRPVHLFGVYFGSLWVALGVLAFYMVVLITVTSLLWVEKKPYTWKLFHLLSYLVLAFVFVHALYLGTDLSHGLWRIVWLLAGLGLGAAVVYRLWRAKTI